MLASKSPSNPTSFEKTKLVSVFLSTFGLPFYDHLIGVATTGFPTFIQAGKEYRMVYGQRRSLITAKSDPKRAEFSEEARAKDYPRCLAKKKESLNH